MAILEMKKLCVLEFSVYRRVDKGKNTPALEVRTGFVLVWFLRNLTRLETIR
jgi:hypothetical protein